MKSRFSRKEKKTEELGVNKLLFPLSIPLERIFIQVIAYNTLYIITTLFWYR